jgi:hypothetical protein
MNIPSRTLPSQRLWSTSLLSPVMEIPPPPSLAVTPSTVLPDVKPKTPLVQPRIMPPSLTTAAPMSHSPVVNSPLLSQRMTAADASSVTPPATKSPT